MIWKVQFVVMLTFIAILCPVHQGNNDGFNMFIKAAHAESDNSWRNKVPSSGQTRGHNKYGCGPIRL